jgi:hypothetical protein
MILWFACSGHPAAETPIAAVAEAPPATAVPAHAAEAEAARDALVFGDVGAFRVRFAALEARLPLEGLDDRMQVPFAAAVHGAAGAADLGEATRQLGRVAVTCGECHTEVSVLPHPRVPPMTDGDGVRAEMARHDRALNLLWNGLVRPDVQDLHRGAETLRVSFLTPLDGAASPDAEALDDAVTAAALRLASTSDPGRRGEQFGAVIALCVSCHTIRPGGLRIEHD